MPFKWASLPLFLLLWLATAIAGPAFENTDVVRSVELGGAAVHVTTTYTVRALQDNVRTYTLALGAGDMAKTSWLEARVSGQDSALSIKERAEEDYTFLDVTLPKALSSDKSLKLVFETVQTHATHPWPATSGQDEDQKLKYTTDLFVISPYSTVSQRTKLRAMVPRILSFTEPYGISPFTVDSVATKSGATVTYGPFIKLPASTDKPFIKEYQQPITIHYHHEQPVLEVSKLKRVVEVSHWGANLNTQDEITLHNAGPKLKGHFSRLSHQMQSYIKKPAPHMLPALTLSLPPGIRNAYYYDQIGNVSTSKLRVAPVAPKGAKRAPQSVLDLRPRYPLLGGWNYSFTLGWDAPLQNSVSYDKKTGAYTLAVPILTPVPGAVVNHEELKIILPEGATDVEFVTPFSPQSVSTGKHVTYLDTLGRPSITLEYKDLTFKHAQEIYVTYKVPIVAHIRKGLAVSAAFFSVFTFAIVFRRLSFSLSSKQKIQ